MNILCEQNVYCFAGGAHNEHIHWSERDGPSHTKFVNNVDSLLFLKRNRPDGFTMGST